MERRRLLGTVGGLVGLSGVAATAPLAGCLGRQTRSGRATSAAGSRPRGGAEPGFGSRSPPGARGLDADDLPLPESALVRAVGRDAIPAIVEPAFAPDWSGVSVTVSNLEFGTYESTPRLGDDDLVVGVAGAGAGGDGRTGDADRAVPRAYPLRVLTWHEVVNVPATPARSPLAVTYCPLCGSAVVGDRRVPVDARGTAEEAAGTEDGADGDGGRNADGGDADGDDGHVGAGGDDGESDGGGDADGDGPRDTLTFGVSGLLWRENLVLYDRETGSLWSQVAARAVRGPLVGAALPLVPATLTTWGRWRDRHPGGEVLLPPPYSNTVSGRAATRDYAFDPYGAYETTDRVGRSERTFADDRLHPKARVLGVAVDDDAARAYPLDRLAELGGRAVVSESVGDRPVVVAPVAGGESAVAYDRRVDGRALRFRRGRSGALVAGGSRWDVHTGEALDGPHRGRRLRRATALPPLFWLSWLGLHPETTVFGTGGGGGAGSGSGR